MESMAVESYVENSKMGYDDLSSNVIMDDKNITQNGAPNEGLIIGITIAVCVILGIVLGIIVAKKTVK